MRNVPAGAGASNPILRKSKNASMQVVWVMITKTDLVLIAIKTEQATPANLALSFP